MTSREFVHSFLKNWLLNATALPVQVMPNGSGDLMHNNKILLVDDDRAYSCSDRFCA
jgi:hypothetical protein